MAPDTKFSTYFRVCCCLLILSTTSPTLAVPGRIISNEVYPPALFTTYAPNALRDYIMDNVEDERICQSESLRHLITGTHNEDNRGLMWWRKHCDSSPRGGTSIKKPYPPGPLPIIPGHKIESTLIRYRRKSKRPKPRRTKPDDNIHINQKDQKALNKLMNNKNILCKPRKTVVELKPPKPHLELKPHCVYIRQCGGCCDSDLLECRPTVIKKRKFKVLNVTPKSNGKVSIAQPPLVKVFAEEHTKCMCQCKIQEEDCNENQIYEHQNCRCVCPKDMGFMKTCGKGKVWSDSKCNCVCQNRRECTTGMIFNDDTCKCEDPKTKAGYRL